MTDQEILDIAAKTVKVSRKGKELRIDYTEFVKALLSRAIPEGHVMVPGWLPIESAPKDGSSIIIVNDRGTFVAEWDKDWGEDGWWTVYDGKFTDRPLRGMEPTHWMPLPAAPANKEGT